MNDPECTVCQNTSSPHGVPPVTAPTPGQAAYEAYCRHVDRISPPPWEHLHSGYQDGWQQVAQAGHAALAAQERPAPGAAPELAEAMRETRLMRELLTEILATFGTPAKPGTVRWTARQVAGWRRRAGLEA